MYMVRKSSMTVGTIAAGRAGGDGSGDVRISRVVCYERGAGRRESRYDTDDLRQLRFITSAQVGAFTTGADRRVLTLGRGGRRAAPGNGLSGYRLDQDRHLGGESVSSGGTGLRSDRHRTCPIIAAFRAERCTSLWGMPERGDGIRKHDGQALHKTYGCQMNVYDSERMADVLRPLGYALTDEQEGADMVVLNTCHIREKAAEKVYSELGRVKEMKGRKEDAGLGSATVVVAGCVAQAEGQEIMRRAPVVDFVVGPQAYHQLPELIARASRAKGERLAADFAADEKFEALPVERHAAERSPPFSPFRRDATSSAPSAWCQHPRREWSRPMETSRPRPAARSAGVREVTLRANVNAYTGGLTKLVRRWQPSKDDRIRSHHHPPLDMDDALIAAMPKSPN